MKMVAWRLDYRAGHVVWWLWMGMNMISLYIGCVCNGLMLETMDMLIFTFNLNST